MAYNADGSRMMSIFRNASKTVRALPRNKSSFCFFVDTESSVKKFQENRFTVKQAEAISSFVNDNLKMLSKSVVLKLEKSFAKMHEDQILKLNNELEKTQKDLHHLMESLSFKMAADMEKKMDGLKSDQTALIHKLQLDIEGLKTLLERVKLEAVKYGFGVFVSLLGIGGGIYRMFFLAPVPPKG